MQAIWKFPLPLEDVATVEMPSGAHVLSVANQGGTLCLWAMCNPEAEREDRSFAIVGTGNPLPSGLGKFVGTALMSPFVWHVFEA